MDGGADRRDGGRLDPSTATATATAAAPDLRLQRGGLRFVDPAEERCYRDWYLGEASEVGVTAFAGAIGMWFAALVAVAVIFDDGVRSGAPICLGLMAYNAGALVVVRRERWRRLVLVAAASTNVVAGLSLLALGQRLLPADLDLTALTGVMVVIIFFGFIQLRLHPALAAASVGVSQVAFLALVVGQHGDGLVAGSRFWLTIVTDVVAYFGALFMGVLIEVQMRSRYTSERTIEWQAAVIDHERERADMLLANLLPAPIVERLKREPGPIAERHDDVSVLFADIVGFTPLSTQLEADEMVGLLNHLFSGFDDIVDELGVTKLRTMGDGYMVAAGLPMPRPDHAAAQVELGLRMLDFVEADPWCQQVGIRLRIGINSGPVIAGVIGRRTFQYDMWSDTVNTAARMESHGVPGRVQVTSDTHRRAAEQFAWEPRGAIEVKGKGPVETWLVAGRRPT